MSYPKITEEEALATFTLFLSDLQLDRGYEELFSHLGCSCETCEDSPDPEHRSCQCSSCNAQYFAYMFEFRGAVRFLDVVCPGFSARRGLVINVTDAPAGAVS